MSSFEYDSRKLPLGKLANSTIEQGFSVLKDLAALLQDPSLASEHGGSLQQAVTTLTNRCVPLSLPSLKCVLMRWSQVLHSHPSCVRSIFARRTR